jgi:WD40 repeat protein
MKKRILISLMLLLISKLALSQKQEPRLVLPVGHTESIKSAIFSQNGELVFTTSSNNQTKVYDVKTGKEIAHLKGEIIEFLNDRRHILMFANNKYLLVDTETFSTKFSYVLNDGYHSFFAFIQTEFFNNNKSLRGEIRYNSDSTQLLINSLTNFILYDLKADKEILNIRLFDDYKKTIKFGDFKENHIPKKQYISDVLFQNNNNEILVETSNDSIQVWDIKSKKIIRLEKTKSNHDNLQDSAKIKNPNKEIKSNFKYNKKEQIAVWTNRWNIQDSSIGIDEITNYSNEESYLVLKNIQTGEIIKKLKGHKKRINAVLSDSKGKYLAVCSQDNICRLWNLSDYTYKDLKYHSKEVNNASFSADGKNIITVSADSSAVIWDTGTGKILKVLCGYSVESKNSILTQNYIINEINDNVYIFNQMTGNIFEIINNCSLLKFKLPSNDSDKKEYNDCIFLQKNKNSFTIRNLKNQTEKTYKLSYSRNLENGNFYMKNDTILFVGYGELILWKKQEQENIKEIDYIKHKYSKSKNYINLIYCLNENLDFALVSSWKGNIYSINTRSGKIYNRFRKINSKKISLCKASIDNKMVIVNKSLGVNAHNLEIWDLKSDKKIWSYKTKDWLHGIQTVHLCKDDKEISIFDNNKIQFYDLNTGNLVYEIPDITGIVKMYNSPNQQYLVITESYQNSAYLTLFDLDKHEILFKSKCHNGLIHNVSFDQNSNFFYSNSSDNSSVFWSIDDKKMLYRRILINGNNWIVHDKNYRYQGTPVAMDKIHYVCDLEVVELNQTKDSLYIPNLVQRIMNGENLDRLPKLSDLNICGVTPIVEPIEKGDGGYHYEVTPQTGGVGDIEIYLNGVVRQTENAKRLKLKNGKYSIQVDPKLIDRYQIPGESLQVKVIAKTANNSISSRGIVIDLKSDEPTSLRKPSLHAVMIGVDDYKDDNLDLNYAAKDANDLHQALEQASKKFFNVDDTNRVFFYNLTINREGKLGTDKIKGKTPDKANINQTLEEIEKKSKPEDILLVFFAGHGEIVDKDQLLLLTTEATSTNFEGIRMRELLEQLNKIPAGKRVLILDACHSGAAINNMDLAKFTGKRDVKDAERQSQRLKELDKLASKSGFAIITASSSEQKALELPQYEHGLMTYALLNAMLNNKSSLDENNQLQLDKWLMATEEEVKKLNQNQSAERMVPVNFVLGKIDDEVRSSIVLKEIPTVYVSNVLNIDLGFDDQKIKGQLLNYFSEKSRGTEKTLFVSEIEQPNSVQVNLVYTISSNQITFKATLLKNNEVVKRIEKSGNLTAQSSLLNELMVLIEKEVK